MKGRERYPLNESEPHRPHRFTLSLREGAATRQSSRERTTPPIPVTPCHCEEGISLTRQSSRTIGQPIASPGHPAPRDRLDCHATLWLAMTSVCGWRPKTVKNLLRPFASHLCHCEEGQIHDAAIQSGAWGIQRIGAGSSPTRQKSGVIERNPYQGFQTRKSASAMWEGVSATAIPASCMASILAAAVPLPPETMAPA